MQPDAVVLTRLALFKRAGNFFQLAIRHGEEVIDICTNP